MPTTHAATALMTLAAQHLLTGGAAARARAGEDAFSLWHGFAGQLDLTAAGLDPMALADLSTGGTVRSHVAAAQDALDGIRPLEGPPDLAMWVWHVAELRRLAEQMEAS